MSGYVGNCYRSCDDCFYSHSDGQSKTWNNQLVGGFNPSEQYEFVSWDGYSQLNGKS